MRLKIPSTPHTIRFPGDLYEKIHLMADNSGRTFNGAVIWLLELGFAAWQKYEAKVAETILAEEKEDAEETVAS